MIKKRFVSAIFVVLLVVFCMSTQWPTQTVSVAVNESDGLKKGLTTAIDYDKQFIARIDSADEARKAIADYGEMQREKYDNEKVIKIEKRLEEKYDIAAVNLGEIDIQTAKDIKKACDYMFKTYPELRGTLTNLSLANFPQSTSSATAITEAKEFIVNDEIEQCPFVMKYQIILNASKYLKRDKLLATCKEQVDIGHWPEGTNITSLVVHELGHQALDVVAMKEYGLLQDGKFNGIYITEDNMDAFSGYITDTLSANQEVPKRVVEDAYQIWLDDYGHVGTQEEFRKSISDYALGVQKDGGISYTETVAEAVADVYLHKKKAADASKAITDIVKTRLHQP